MLLCALGARARAFACASTQSSLGNSTAALCRPPPPNPHRHVACNPAIPREAGSTHSWIISRVMSSLSATSTPHTK